MFFIVSFLVDYRYWWIKMIIFKPDKPFSAWDACLRIPTRNLRSNVSFPDISGEWHWNPSAKCHFYCKTGSDEDYVGGLCFIVVILTVQLRNSPVVNVLKMVLKRESATEVVYRTYLPFPLFNFKRVFCHYICLFFLVRLYWCWSVQTEENLSDTYSSTQYSLCRIYSNVLCRTKPFVFSQSFSQSIAYNYVKFEFDLYDKKVCNRWLHMSAPRVKRETCILPIGSRCL